MLVESTSDEDLIAQIASGDRAAWRPLYERYAILGTAVAYRAFGPGATDEAKAVVGEVLFDCVNRFDPHRGSRFRPFFLVRLRGEVLNELRRGARGGLVGGPGPRRGAGISRNTEFAESDPPAPGSDPSDQLGIRPYLGTLEPEDQQLIMWRFEVGLRQSEIADSIGKSEAWVSRRVALLLRQIRTTL